jgi:hypothetical protein
MVILSPPVLHIGGRARPPGNDQGNPRHSRRRRSSELHCLFPHEICQFPGVVPSLSWQICMFKATDLLREKESVSFPTSPSLGLEPA